MKFRWLTIFACLLVTACSESSKENAPTSTKPEASPLVEPASPATDPGASIRRFEAAKAKYDAAIQEFTTKYRAASEEDRKELVENEAPEPAEYADEFMKLAAEYPNHEIAFDSLCWVVSNVPSGQVADQACSALLTDHIDDAEIKNICMRLSYREPGPQIESHLKTIIEKSPHDQVKASATYALASYYLRLDKTRQALADDPDLSASLDEKSVAYLNEREVESTAIEALFQTLIEEYPKLKPREGSRRNYKSMAESALFEMRNLAIGLVAPEIEGDDLDGVNFKLSDYRGKIVVLDFWGDW